MTATQEAGSKLVLEQALKDVILFVQIANCAEHARSSAVTLADAALALRELKEQEGSEKNADATRRVVVANRVAQGHRLELTKLLGKVVMA